MNSILNDNSLLSENSLFNKNLLLFNERFPALSKQLKKDLEEFNKLFEQKKEGAFPFCVEEAKNKTLTALEKSLPLHSKYNPEREAEQQVSQYSYENYDVAVFFAFGLGYAPKVFAKTFSKVPLILIEPDATRLFAAFCVLDWSEVLNHEQVVFAIKTPEDIVSQLLHQYKSSKLCIFSNANQVLHAKEYFLTVTESLKRNKEKEEINTNTLEKFAHLWLNNSCKNLHYLETLDGIEKFRNAVPKQKEELPFIVLAAGPSLSSILPHLAELKKRAIIVCVDTALHSCLSVGVEPDFVILVDPQYVCAMHLEFLSSPSSILITESAAWQSVFRFNCKEIVLCASMFPIGQYFEKKLGSKGVLGAGGSVTTTAWDFARICGAKKIYIAGMDLGFPGGQTHIRGSQFEERAHRLSNRFFNAECSTIQSLMSASPSYAKDYNGNSILTDKRMSLFSWWFEKNCTQSQQEGTYTYSLTPQSLAINGITKESIETLLCSPTKLELKKEFFEQAKKNSEKIKNNLLLSKTKSFAQVLSSFKENLETLESLAKKGLNLCEKALGNRLKAPQIFSELEVIDSKILNSEAKEAATLVFPTERKLKELTANLPQTDKQVFSLMYSKVIYTELLKSVLEYLSKL